MEYRLAQYRLAQYRLAQYRLAQYRLAQYRPEAVLKRGGWGGAEVAEKISVNIIFIYLGGFGIFVNFADEPAMRGASEED